MNVWLGRGRRKDDWIPYRSMGPLTQMEYISRKDRYDKYLNEKIGMNEEEIEKIDIDEKIKIIYNFRRDQYEKLTDAVYYRRGWTPNGVPTPDKMKELGFSNNKKMLKMLKEKIEEDEKANLNVWAGNYSKNEKIPNNGKKYWL